MKHHTSNQSGFAALEAVLIVVIVAIVAGTGWYVWHSKQTTDKSYTQTATVANAPAKQTTGAGLTYYDCLAAHNGIPNGNDGVSCTDGGKTYQLPDTFSTAMINGYSKLPASAQGAVTALAQTLYNEDSAPTADPRGPAEVIVVTVDSTQFIKLDLSGVEGNTDILYDNAGQWQSIYKANEHDIDCSVIQQYKIPLSVLQAGSGVNVISKCLDSSGAEQSVSGYAK